MKLTYHESKTSKGSLALEDVVVHDGQTYDFPKKEAEMLLRDFSDRFSISGDLADEILQKQKKSKHENDPVIESEES